MKLTCLIVAVILSLTSTTIAHPIDSDETGSQEVPVLRPPPTYDSEEYSPYDDNNFDKEDEFGAFANADETDPEEAENDSGFHREPGHDRPDGALARKRRNAQDNSQENESDLESSNNENEEYVNPTEDDNETGEIDEEFSFGDDEDYEYESDYEGSESEKQPEDSYEFPTFSQEEDDFTEDENAIDEGDFDDEEEVGADESGSLLRLSHL